MSDGRAADGGSDDVRQTSDGPRERLPGFLTPPFLRTVGLVALIALVGELVVLPRLVCLDDALWRAILHWRGCAADRIVDRVVGLTTGLAIGLLVAAVLLRARRDGLRTVWPPVAVCLLGLHVGKVLKNVFARERPSMLHGAIIGHSFPSGHVMNTALAALAIVVLAATFRHPRRWWSAAGALITIIVLGRLLLAHHWLLDALGALLAAVALNGLALPAVRRRPLLVPVSLALALTLVLAIATHWGLRIPLASPLSTHEHDGVELRVADALGSAGLRGGWEGPVEHFRRGTFLWLEGAGSVVLTLPARDRVRPIGSARDVPAGWQASLAIAGRPDLRERRCLTMRVRVNGHALPSFVPFVGWREYRLLVPLHTLRPGRNEIGVEVADASGAPWRFAIAYLRVDLD
jgi:membrane-associated phospholipid phosphatase